MTNEEIKANIAKLEKAISSAKKMGGQEENIKKLEAGKAKFEAMLKPEKPAEKKEKPATKKKITKKTEKGYVSYDEVAKKYSSKKGYHVSWHQRDNIVTGVPSLKMTVTKQREPLQRTDSGRILTDVVEEYVSLSGKQDKYIKVKTSDKKDVKSQPKKETPLIKKALKQPKQKDLTIEKGEKKEKHTITTGFESDIKGAIVTLNKERFILREVKDKKTGTVEKVKHSPEFKNAKTIERKVNSIFDSSLWDIAKTKKDREAKKEIISEVEEIRDLTTLWLNEVDLIINNENKTEISSIKKLMIGLIKEARKNDPDDKYKLAGGLEKIAKKYNL